MNDIKTEFYREGEPGLFLVSPIPPSVNHYTANRAIVRNGKPICIKYTTKESDKYKKEFCEYVKGQAKAQGWMLDENKYQHYYVDTVFYFDSASRDPNNYYKLILDAITDTGVVWIDDNITCERVQKILYDSDNPRIELYIHPVDYIGVFENASQLDKFISSNCIGCKRYQRNCSILKKAKEAKVQIEIKENECSCIQPANQKKEIK